MIVFGDGNLRIPHFDKPVYIVAAGMTDFRKKYPEKSAGELTAAALDMAVAENDLKVSMPEFKRKVNFCVYSQFADHFGDQLLAGARVHDAVGATGIFQIAEVFWQLQNKWAQFHADPRMWERFGKTMSEDLENLQVLDARRGAAISHAGTGSHVTMAILDKV